MRQQFFFSAISLLTAAEAAYADAATLLFPSFLRLNPPATADQHGFGHPLGQTQSPGLAHISQYPIITYHEGFTARSKIGKAFSEVGIVPDIVRSKSDQLD
jgi:hypothetical protein